jgi:ferrous iron transport protein B
VNKNHIPKIALVGNPNSGKSTLFNALTGLHQKTGNLPGVTVEHKTGFLKIKEGNNDRQFELIDLPGTYSLYPKSADEDISFNVICDPSNPLHPDMMVVVADAANLKRSLLLCTQIIDLKIPVILALNMVDTLKAKACSINIELLSKRLGIAVVPLNSRKTEGLDDLKKAINNHGKGFNNIKETQKEKADFIDIKSLIPEVINEIRLIVHTNSDYSAFQVASNLNRISYFDLHPEKKKKIQALLEKYKPNFRELQGKETILRYQAITDLVRECITYHARASVETTHKLDRICTHKILGYLTFILILFFIFQTIFSFAQYPMDFIENLFSNLALWFGNSFPQGVLNGLISQGIIPGMAGVVVFVPQIALLFTFIAILEDTGYMARVSFIMDKPMRKFGLNGRSVIPLISSTACAVPSIMSARTISNWKERIITIMISPLMSCSARLPVYVLLISLVIPNVTIGIFSLQALVMTALYLTGFVAALGVAWIMKHILKSKEKSFFVMEMPDYKLPDWRTIGITLIDKVKAFVVDAGKIILAISIILWVLSSYAPGNAFEQIDKKYAHADFSNYSEQQLSSLIQAEKLENSYMGKLGKGIEPIIEPLGFNWKVGIALITSFAAREVFVGTMSTIYSLGNDESSSHLREKMGADINPKTGKSYYSLAVGVSLLLFYVFAMQCMSTLAIVFRETRHWKWPLIQFLYMTGLAYLVSWAVYNLLK